MRLDNGHVFCHGTMGHEPDSKPVECNANANAVDSIGLKSGKGNVKENENGRFSDLKGMEGDADRFPNLAPTAAPHSSPKMESVDKDSVFYMDKNVMEREVPELIICYKENTYHVVKDICIDEGVPLQDKFLLDTGVHEKDVCAYLPSERADLDIPIPDVLTSSAENQTMNLHMSVPDVLKSSEEKGSKCDLSPECNDKYLMPTREIMDYDTKKVANAVSKEILSLGDLLAMPELGEKLIIHNSSKNTTDEVEEQSFQGSSENAILETVSAHEESKNDGKKTILVNSTSVSAVEESHNGHEEAILAVEVHHGQEGAVLLGPTAEELDDGNKEAKLASHALDSSSEESTSRTADELSYNSKEETRSISADDLLYDSKVETRSITFNFDSSAPTASGREESSQNGESQPLGSQILSRHEDPNTEPISSQLQYVNGETSFSASGPLSGLITYSGPIAYSGSLSLRSDSSTTSTRSFAFPILQSEWNSSPVRMAKADQRHFRKPRSWRQGLLCCRF